MEFLNLYLLGGLALLGVPVLVHLMMRQKPRRLPFPAFRFLRQRHIVNRRRMRLQHLLLLLLRMAVLAAVCLAVAQPKLFLPRAAAAWFGLGGPGPAAAVFVFDAGPHMDYRVGGLSRLDDARQRALELLQQLPADSRVAVLDTGGDDAGDGDDDWLTAPGQVRSRINGLRPRPVRDALPRVVARGAEMLARAGEGGGPSSRRLYVFSDRTTASWDADAARAIQVPGGLEATYIDLGAEHPADLAIEKVEVKPAVAPPGAPVMVHAEVRAVGGDFDADLLCQLDGEETAALQHVRLSGSSRGTAAFDFTLKAPASIRPPGAAEGAYTEAHQVVVKFAAADDAPFKDDLPHDNVRYATFLVRDDSKRQGREVLTVADDLPAARFWDAALRAYQPSHPFEGFAEKLMPSSEAAKLKAADLQPYRVVCLFQTAKPLGDDFWNALEEYVNQGGGLAIVPPEKLDGADLAKWNEAAAKHRLLPARLLRLADAPNDSHTRQHVYWQDFRANHPLTRPFYDWIRGANPDFADAQYKPFVNRYWQVAPVENESLVVASYADPAGSPALVEGRLNGDAEGSAPGRVLMFTTSLDWPKIGDSDIHWHNFYDGSFGLVLINEACKYLAGDMTDENPNYLCGAPVVLPLPKSAPRGVYRLDAPDPDLTESERSITVGKDDRTLEVRAAAAPGQYTVYDPNRNRFAGFSLNVAPDESRLDRLPDGEIEKALGPGSVVRLEPGASLNDALSRRPQTTAAAPAPPALVDLLPALMMLTLLFLTVEGLLANRFYQRPAGPESQGEQSPA